MNISTETLRFEVYAEDHIGGFDVSFNFNDTEIIGAMMPNKKELKPDLAKALYNAITYSRLLEASP